MQELELIYPTTKGKVYSEEEDRYLLRRIYQYGVQVDDVYERIISGRRWSCKLGIIHHSCGFQRPKIDSIQEGDHSKQFVSNITTSPTFITLSWPSIWYLIRVGPITLKRDSNSRFVQQGFEWIADPLVVGVFEGTSGR